MVTRLSARKNPGRLRLDLGFESRLLTEAVGFAGAQNPARLRLLPLLLGLAAPIHCVEWQADGPRMPIWVLPRPPSGASSDDSASASTPTPYVFEEHVHT